MGWAAERAARIVERQEAESKRELFLLQKRTMVANHAGSLWNSLAEALIKETEDFAQALPLAKDLQAHRFNSNNVTIMTRAFPVIKFEILYEPGIEVRGTLTETFSGLGETKTYALRRFGFTADSNLQPCFTDGERYLHPCEVAQELMERVAQFFEKASKMPSFL
jgi:hypothetical protein